LPAPGFGIRWSHVHFRSRGDFTGHVSRKTHVRPYHFAVAGLLGLITGIFGLVLVLMILTSTNFNVLGWME
jgi:hypothetical protein